MNKKDNNSPRSFSLKNNNLYLMDDYLKPIKIANNVYTYAYFKSTSNDIHICYIDLKNKLVYCQYQNGVIKKRNICRLICNKKNITDIQIHIFKESLNIFIIECNEYKSYNIIHINHNLVNSDSIKHTLTELYFSCLSIYMLPSNQNYLILSLKHDYNSVHNEYKYYFDLNSKVWSKFNNTNLNNELISYCRNLKYT